MAFNYILYIAVFFLGASIGSFVNAAAIRLKTGEPFVTARSHCPHCLAKLRWFELVPVISYLALGGRCLRCRHGISPRYLLTEVALGAFFAMLIFSFLESGFSYPFVSIVSFLGTFGRLFALLLYLILGSALALIFLVDYDAQQILVGLVRIVTAAGTVLLGVEIWLSPSGIFHPVAVKTLWLAVAVALFFALLWALTRARGLGWGDVELAFAASLFLNFPTALVMVLLAFWIGSLWGLGLILAKGYTLKSRVPFGPFLITGFVLALFWGNILVAYLLQLV